MGIGEALRLLRIYNDMKAVQVSEDLGISQSYISEIEQGKKIPSIEVINKYASYFHTTPSAILLMAEGLEKDPKSFKERISGKLAGLLQELENSNAE